MKWKATAEVSVPASSESFKIPEPSFAGSCVYCRSCHDATRASSLKGKWSVSTQTWHANSCLVYIHLLTPIPMFLVCAEFLYDNICTGDSFRVHLQELFNIFHELKNVNNYTESYLSLLPRPANPKLTNFSATVLEVHDKRVTDRVHCPLARATEIQGLLQTTTLVICHEMLKSPSHQSFIKTKSVRES